MKQEMSILVSLILLTTPVLAESTPPREWDFDNRRCRVLAHYDGIDLIIKNDEGELQVDVWWITGQKVEKQLSDYDDGKLFAQIDGGKKIKLEPLRSDNGSVYGYRLGKHEEFAPIISRGDQLYVGSGGAGTLSQFLDLTGSTKAMKFLKKCQRFWERWHEKRK